MRPTLHVKAHLHSISTKAIGDDGIQPQMLGPIVSDLTALTHIYIYKTLKESVFHRPGRGPRLSHFLKLQTYP